MRPFLILGFIFAAIGAPSLEITTAVGSSANPIRVSLVPGQDAKILSDEGQVLIEYLQKKTGYHFHLDVPFNFITVVETLGSSRTDMALMNSFGYLLAHEKYQARVRLMGELNGKAEYWGQIITAKPEIQKLEDLKGKKFAFVDPASTSGYVLPFGVLQKRNSLPKETIFAGKHDSVVIAVYQKQVDAGATYHTAVENGEPQDARKLVKTQFPDVFSKVRILELTGPIPSDPVVFRKNFPRNIENKVVQALLDFANSKEGPSILRTLYNFTGLRKADDTSYEPLRKMIHDLGKSTKDFVQ